MVEGRDQLDVPRQQHPVAEHVAGHVADADGREVVGVRVEPQRREVPAHRLPGAAGGDAHLLVVVALGAARGERVAEPVPVPPGDLVGHVGERRGPLVRGDDQVRVVAVEPDHAGRRDHGVADDVVGDVEHRADERPVAGEHLRLVGVPVGRVGQPLADEPALRAGRDDDRVLHLLRLDQAEHLGAEVLGPLRPAQAAARDRAEPQVHRLKPRRVDPDLVLGPRRGHHGHPLGGELEHQVRRVLAVVGALVVVGAQGGVDQRQVSAQDAVVVQADHLVERAAQLLGDRRAALLRAGRERRVEPGLEQPHQEPGDRRVGVQHPLQVVLAELEPRLPQVPRVRAQHRDLPPAEVRVEHQAVELVVLGVALPQRGERRLEPGAQRVGLGVGHRAPPAADAEVVDPERLRGATELVRVLVEHLKPHVLQLRQHIGERQR